MNQQALNYHTRLHDWYRRHSIQQDKQADARAIARQAKPSSELIATGVLTRDKLHFIDEWCSDVNRTMFSIKKKEASPLYRKCRLSAPIKAALKDRLSGTRRVRSAEVFTLRGEWTKAPKAKIRGGELLADSRAARHSASHSDGRGTREVNSRDTKNLPGASGDGVDFCVTNSLDKSNDVTATMPRVNHDSFDRRIHPSITKKSVNAPAPISPRGYVTTHAGNVQVKEEKEASEQPIAPRAKSAYVLRPSQDERGKEDNPARQSSAKTLPKSHKVSERKEDANTSKQAKRVASASQKSLKASTVVTTSVGDAEIRGILNSMEPDTGRGTLPTFCGKCSGIYSGNAPPPPTPVTCGSCIHGITMNGKSNGQNEMGPSNAEIQKELAKKLVQTEKLYNKKITNANIQLKMSENRVTEDSIHYTKEREIARDGKPRSETLLSRPEDNIPDDADLSIQNCDGDNDLSFDAFENKAVSDGEHSETYDKENKVTVGMNVEKHIPTVTIVTDDEHDGENNENTDKRDSISIDEEKLSAYFKAQVGNRRMSIHFTYKPEVANPSISNKLLHFLSIDDCKQAMRYHPHKILEKHEVADNLHLALANNLALQGLYGEDNENETNSTSGNVAMRISKGSTITSLPSSSANVATNMNKKQYKILFDPDNLDYYKNRRPNSLSLAKAFNTLIYDRTIMQRLENKTLGHKTKALNNVGKTSEGPKYRLINAALKKQMGDKMQAQCQQMVHRYQRSKSGVRSTKRQAQTGTPSHSSDRSLSLDSLPSVRRGTWKDSSDALNVE